MRIREIKESGEIAEIYRKLGLVASTLFYKEEISLEKFLWCFGEGGSFLYECYNDEGVAVGIVFFFAVTEWAVKIGTAGYGGHAKASNMREVLGIVEGELRRRGAKVLIAEVPSAKTALRKILPKMGFSMSGCIPHYFGDEGMLYFVKGL